MMPSMMEVCSIGRSPFTRYHRRSQPCSSRSSSSCWEREQLETMAFQLLLELSASHFPHRALQTAAPICLRTPVFCTFKGAVALVVKPFASFVQFFLLTREPEVTVFCLFHATQNRTSTAIFPSYFYNLYFPTFWGRERLLRFSPPSSTVMILLLKLILLLHFWEKKKKKKRATAPEELVENCSGAPLR